MAGFLTSSSVSLNNGSNVVNVTGSVDCSFVVSGTAVYINDMLMEGVAGTAADPSGNSTITLRNVYTGTSIVGGTLVSFNTIEGLRDAIQRARELSAQFQEGLGDITQTDTSLKTFLTVLDPTTTITFNDESTVEITPYQVLMGKVEAQGTASGVTKTGGGSVQDFINAQYTTVAEVETGKFQVGSYVRPTDRDLELFEILASGTADGLGIIDAGGGKVAIYRPKMTINPKAFGAKYDGVTLDTAANNAASVWCTALLIPVLSPAGTSVTGNITYYHKFKWSGSGVALSIFKAAPNGTSDVFTSANFDALTGTNSDDGVYEPEITDLFIDGNRDRSGNSSGITTGKGLRFYGRTNRFRRLKIYNCAEEGFISEWGDGASLAVGLEGIFDDIECAYNGKDGWTFLGPHDSHCFDIICHSNSQSASSVYENLAVKKGNARWSRVHTYSLFYTDQGSPIESARQKTSMHIYRAAEGNEFSQCHVEGGDVNFHNEANGTKFWGGRIYYPWATGINIINEGSGVTIEATLGEEYKGIGLPLAKGLVLGSTYEGVSNSTFKLSGSGMEAGWVDFGGSAGGNLFEIQGYNATEGNTAYLSQPHATDTVNLYVSGSNLVALKTSLIQLALKPVSLIPLGTVQNDAQGIYKYTRYVKVVVAAPDSGLRMSNPSLIGSGNKLTIFNKTASSIKLYPSIGGDLLGYGINNPVVIPPLKTLDVLVDDVNAGTFLVSGPY